MIEVSAATCSSAATTVAAAAAVDQQCRLLIGQRLGHFAPDALIGHKDGVFNMTAIVFLPGADIHHHDLLRDHHLIGVLGADLLIRRLACHVLRRVRFCLGQRAAAQQRKRGGKCRKKKYLTHNQPPTQLYFLLIQFVL